MLDETSSKEGKSDIMLERLTEVPASSNVSTVLVSVSEELSSPVSE
jgi:hypothetical protein